MHKQAINHKQAIIGGGYLFTENACLYDSVKCHKLQCLFLLFLIYMYILIKNGGKLAFGA